MFRIYALLIASLIFQICPAQQKRLGSADVYAKIEKLNFLGSVLYIAAHPDDENTRLISYFSNTTHARTAYLSLTRGDGGQNLIGPELREQLGVIRTQELLEARKIDGGTQYFSRANDFGYSKNPDETFSIWNKEAVLSDVVRVIRQFRPDIIVNRFDHRTPGSTHGHHTASAILSTEAFDLSGTSDARFQLSPWKPKRLYMNTSWWFYGSREKFEKADKSNLIKIPTGTFYPENGYSNQEIAAFSRSSHKSQGFGTSGVRGSDEEYLEFLKGDRPKNNTALFEGIDTSWNRIEGGKPIGNLVENILKNYDFKHPEKSVPELLKAYTMISNLKDDFWKEVKLAEVKDIIAQASGLFLEASAEKPQASPGETVKVRAEVVNRSEVPMSVEKIWFEPKSDKEINGKKLTANSDEIFESEVAIPKDFPFTQPYWLIEKPEVGMFNVSDEKLIGKPESPRHFKAHFEIRIGEITIDFQRDIIYKFNNDVKGEQYTPFDIVPAITTNFQDKVALFTSDGPKEIKIKVVSEKPGISARLSLNVDKSWTVKPEFMDFEFDKSEVSRDFSFFVTPPKGSAEATLKASVIFEEHALGSEKVKIEYPHIPRQLIFKTSEARLIRPDLKITPEKIAYIMGAGDQVPAALRMMGYEVSELKPEEITAQRLKSFNVVMTGIRAYNMLPALALKQHDLLEFVKNGGKMIVQYNTLDELVTPDMSPYPIKLSRNRITREDSPVRFINEKDPMLNYPNKLSTADFDGWIQERGLYFPSEWATEFRTLLSMEDPKEKSQDSAILVANYGKGTYVYTGLSFFRELPEGVVGAYRLMANLIASEPKTK